MRRIAAALLVLGMAVASWAAANLGHGAGFASPASASTQAMPPVPALAPTGVTPADCGAPLPGHVGCFAISAPGGAGLAGPAARGARAGRSAAVTPAAAFAGYGPEDIASMYGIPASARSTATIAVIEAGADVNTAAVLDYYRAYFGLPLCRSGCLTELNQYGGTSLPYIGSPNVDADAGWVLETDLDLEAVSAACPTCHLLLVDAKSSSAGDMDQAVQTAVSHGAGIVSMSWGSSLADDPASDSDASVYHGAVVYVAATGDNGYHAGDGGSCQTVSSTSDHCAEYPAAFSNVVAVGGTSVTPAGPGWNVTDWGGISGGAGSGCTAAAVPSFQSGVNTQCNGRAVADVSALADPDTGMGVFVDNGDGSLGQGLVGGTSLATPIIAALYALEGNATVGPGAPYANAAAAPSLIRDVTSGSATGSCAVARWCTPMSGWDGPTGLGTPTGLGLFSSSTPSPTALVLSPQRDVRLVARTGQQLAAAPLSVSGGTGAATWTVDSLPTGLSLNAATGVISGSVTRAGASSFVMTATQGAAHASEAVELDVYDPVTVTGGTLSATVGHAVSTRPVAVAGGSGAQDWFADDLPGWLDVDPSTGTFTGTPTASDVGTTVVTITACDHDDTDLCDQAPVTVTVAASSAPPSRTSGPTASAIPGPASQVTATVVHLSTGRIVHTKRARVRVSVTGGAPAGTVVVYDGTRRIAVVAVTPLNHARLTVLLKKLARGRHRLRVVFTPSVSTVLASSTTVIARVR